MVWGRREENGPWYSLKSQKWLQAYSRTAASIVHNKNILWKWPPTKQHSHKRSEMGFSHNKLNLSPHINVAFPSAIMYQRKGVIWAFEIILFIDKRRHPLLGTKCMERKRKRVYQAFGLSKTMHFDMKTDFDWLSSVRSVFPDWSSQLENQS